jgi:hypothetical protein
MQAALANIQNQTVMENPRVRNSEQLTRVASTTAATM